MRGAPSGRADKDVTLTLAFLRVVAELPLYPVGDVRRDDTATSPAGAVASGLVRHTTQFWHRCDFHCRRRHRHGEAILHLSTPIHAQWRSTMPNQTSTRFIQEAWVGVKWTVNLGWSASQVFTAGCLCAA
jgi:hypothetical protein